MTVTAPATSKVSGRSCARLSAIRRGARNTAPTAIGTFTNSTQRQVRYSVRMPPSSTPTAPPEPATAPHTPSARLRSEPSLNVVVRIESAAGESSAAPRPWTARAPISIASLWARPPTSDAAANRTRPVM